MRFGTKVVVTRGGGSPKGTPGCSRTIYGTLVGARGLQRRVRIDRDDPLATCDYCTRAGDVGWWSKSAVLEREGASC